MKLLIFDGNSIANRAFYGVRPLTNGEGLHTNAVYGFLNIVLKFMEEEQPDEAAVAFDLKEKTFRHALYDGYKAKRRDMPGELAEQMPIIHELVDALGIARLSAAGYEADDIIGTLCQNAESRGAKCVIVTGDRDSLQLVSDLVTVKLAVPRQGSTETAVYDKAAVTERYGVPPKALLDVKALMGDASDNIPGVAGVGEKTALELIGRFGGLDSLYENLDEAQLRPALREKLERGRADAYMSLRLAKICRDVPLKLPEDALKVADPDRAALRALFHRLEFASFISRFGLDAPGAFENASTKRAEAVCPSSLAALADELRASGKAYFLYCDGAVWVCHKGAVCRVEEGREGFEAFLEAVFADSGIKKYTHDAKPLALRLLKSGLELEGLAFDTRLAEYLLNPALPSHSLSDIARRYRCGDTGDTAALASLLPGIVAAMEERIAEQGQQELLYEIEQPLCPVLASMEHRGFKVDRKALLTFRQELDDRLCEVTERIYALAGRPFNLNSPKQLGEILFVDLGLPPVQKTKTGYSTSAQVLERLSGFHEIIDYIGEHRQLAKLRSTYAQALSEVIEDDGRIHTSFHQTVTLTGRLSSSEPNLQNIPVRYEMGRRLRRMFVPENDDYLLVAADYSQIELRVLAHLARDRNMIEAFLNGEDIHRRTASEVFGVPYDEVAPEMRSRAKAVNFGIVYGISDFSLAKDIKVPRREAKRYIDEYFGLYEGVRAYMDEVVRAAVQNGYVTTLFGRRRYIPELSAHNKNTRAFGERVARNTPVQGTAADIIKIAMVRVHERLKKSGLRARLIMQVHDELIVEAPREELEAVSAILREEMEGAAQLSVPLLAEVHSGTSWYDVK